MTTTSPSDRHGFHRFALFFSPAPAGLCRSSDKPFPGCGLLLPVPSVARQNGKVTMMDAQELIRLQQQLGLSDTKMAAALGVTRQTWRNWRTGRTVPALAQNALRWLMELRRVSPSNDNIPPRLRFIPVMLLALAAASEVLT